MTPARLFPSLLCVACAVAVLAGLFTPTRAAADPEPRASVLREAAAEDEDTVLYPPQHIALHFDHARHAKLGTGCVYCHDGAAKSRVVADRLLPPPARCDACHGSNHEHIGHVEAGVGAAADCGYCHVERGGGAPNDVERTVLPPANLRFDHAAHTSRGIPCARCHGGVERAALATASGLPRMKLCTSCHSAGGSAKDGCDVCHLTTISGRLKTRFASGDLMPGPSMHDAEHGPDWTFRHKLVAGADSARCATCHSEEECTDCHDGRVRPRQVHPNDWLNLHAIAARQDEQSCESCHRASSFCITCHQRAGVAMSGPAGNAATRGRFHPPRSVWTDPPRTPSHHAWEAERNITACVSCHTERDCATCHATAARGGQGGLSPHPVGFSASCRNAFVKNPRPCLYCHDSGDPSLTACR
ncbi:MAG TPA: cytochrome c3 family protein [Polyangiaceae bacterium]|nr:cytochrome c3 family protein [Polyangiaceae bacterium]